MLDIGVSQVTRLVNLSGYLYDIRDFISDITDCVKVDEQIIGKVEDMDP